MTNAILAVIVVALSICGMAIGLIVKNKPLSPSCGGVYLSKGETCQVWQSQRLRLTDNYLPHLAFGLLQTHLHYSLHTLPLQDN